MRCAPTVIAGLQERTWSAKGVGANIDHSSVADVFCDLFEERIAHEMRSYGNSGIAGADVVRE